MRILILVLIFALPGICHSGEVYKWRDKNGNIHYSDVEPPKQQAERKVVKSKTDKPLTAEQLAAKEKAAEAARKAAACEFAQSRMKIITGSSNITMDLNNDGVPETLTPAQRAAQADLIKAEVTVQCTK